MYFHGADGIAEVAKSGGAVTSVAKLNDVMALAVGDDVYALCLAGPTTQRLFKVPKKGGTPTELATTGGTGLRMLLAQGCLWFDGSGGGAGEVLFREPVGGGTPIKATPNDDRIQMIRGLASDGNGILFAASGRTDSEGGVFRVATR